MSRKSRWLWCWFILLSGSLPGQTVTDADGNVYSTVTIASRVWMAENLKTTRFRDSTGIPEVSDTSAWGFQSGPARCWYGNTSTYKDIFGALYNGYAVASGKLCPAGWHVPDTAEWDGMIRFLGGKETAGGKLKSKGSLETGTSYWFTPNTGATNESGFSGQPGGARELDGVFHYLFSHGYFWTSSPAGSGFLSYRLLSYNYPDVLSGPLNLQDGLSVRCIKDGSQGNGIPTVRPPVRFHCDPAGHCMTIESDRDEEISISVADMTGRVLLALIARDGSQEIDLGRWPKGLFVVRISGSFGTVTWKFIR